MLLILWDVYNTIINCGVTSICNPLPSICVWMCSYLCVHVSSHDELIHSVCHVSILGGLATGCAD